MTDLRDEVAAAIVRHARDVAPEECCGLLLGSEGQVVEAVRARNAADHPDREFLIDPHDHVVGQRTARERGLEVVGFYHSHPRSPAEPSPRDLAEFSYPDHLYVIASLCAEPAEIGVFWFADGAFQRVAGRTA